MLDRRVSQILRRRGDWRRQEVFSGQSLWLNLLMRNRAGAKVQLLSSQLNCEECESLKNPNRPASTELGVGGWGRNWNMKVSCLSMSKPPTLPSCSRSLLSRLTALWTRTSCFWWKDAEEPEETVKLSKKGQNFLIVIDAGQKLKELERVRSPGDQSASFTTWNQTWTEAQTFSFLLWVKSSADWRRVITGYIFGGQRERDKKGVWLFDWRQTNETSALNHHSERVLTAIVVPPIHPTQFVVYLR